MKPFGWLFEEEALRVLLAWPWRRRRQILGAIERLAAHPSQPGHLHYHDLRGREVRVWLVDGCEIHYSIDHAVREVRVVDLQHESMV